jgi:hypothetical protein
MANEVTIIIKAKNETKAAFTAARKDAEKLGKDLGDIINDHVTQSVTTNASGGQATTKYEQAGKKIGDAIGKSIRERISEHIKVAFEKIKIDGDKIKVDIDYHDKPGGNDSHNSSTTNNKDTDRNKIRVKVDVDESSRQSLLQKFKGMATDIGANLKSALSNGLTTAFSGDLISTVVKVFVTSLAVGLGSPVIGAAVVSSIMLALGGGVLALGIAGAFKDPRIMGAAKNLGTQLETIFAKFGEPFRGPLANFMEKFSDFLAESQPLFDKIAQTFAPVLDALGTGFIAALQNILPGLTDAIVASAPFFEALADHLPEIGQRIGDMFRDFSESGPDALQFFTDLLSFVEKLIGFISRLINNMAKLYSKVHDLGVKGKRAFNDLKDGALGSFGTIRDAVLTLKGNITGYFYSAAATVAGVMYAMASNAASVVATIGTTISTIQGYIDAIRPRTITVRIRQVVSTIGNVLGGVLGNAHGGIVGAASGGVHSGMRMVGEAGPELVDLPAGTRVYPTGASKRMMGGGQGDGIQQLLVTPMRGADSELLSAMLKMLRYEVRTKANGSVQQLLGVPGKA